MVLLFLGHSLIVASMLETPQYVFSRVSDALGHKLLTPILKARSLESPTTNNVKIASKKTFQEHVKLPPEKDHIFFHVSY